jgi:hypothetical protein
VMVAVIAGVVYATKDRMQELGRSWISGNVHRFYAQRVARYRAPVRRLPGRDVIVSARESCDQADLSRPDPLNPESGATVPATSIHYMHKGVVSPQAQLTRGGVRRIKHVFRYDLSPLFARLDDTVKPVPVLDAATGRVKFTDAPRCYRLPVRVKVTCGGTRSEEIVTLVLHKRGLDRLDRDEPMNDLPLTVLREEGTPEEGPDDGLPAATYAEPQIRVNSQAQVAAGALDDCDGETAEEKSLDLL